MRPIAIGGVLLLLGGSICTYSKPEPLVFVFLRVDAAQDLAMLRPMIAPDIGVQLDSGTRELKQGTVLRCGLSAREHAAIVEGKVGRVNEMVLDCGERKFIVKTIDFRPRRQ